MRNITEKKRQFVVYSPLPQRYRKFNYLLFAEILLMSILKEASVQNLIRLLDLYPAASLRDQWPDIKGSKLETCVLITAQRDIDTITQFLDEYLGCCRQHIYVYSHNGNLRQLPEINLPDAEKELEDRGSQFIRQLHVIKFDYTVVLKEPLEEAKLTFLWPVRLDFTPQHLIVRFVILEKDIGSYVQGRRYYVDRRSTEEKAVLKAIEEALADDLELRPLDLHTGIKALWDKGLIDSSQARFKKAFSTAFEAMDEQLRIKEHAPDLYALIMESLLFNTIFEIVGKADLSVSTFTVDPSKGYIAFPRYSEQKGDTDYVVEEILRNN
jgi:hypothetical protein